MNESLELKKLNRAAFNEVVGGVEKILLYIYKENHAPSFLGFALMNEINRLCAKDFEIFTVCADTEPEICDLLQISEVPEYICIKHSKIHKRAFNLKYSNQIMDLLT